MIGRLYHLASLSLDNKSDWYADHDRVASFMHHMNGIRSMVKLQLGCLKVAHLARRTLAANSLCAQKTPRGSGLLPLPACLMISRPSSVYAFLQAVVAAGSFCKTTDASGQQKDELPNSQTDK